MIELISTAVICLAWGYYFGIKHANEVIQNENKNQENLSAAKENLYYIEKHDDILYLYNIKHDFICQGKTVDELIANAHKFKNIELVMTKHNGEIILYNKEKITVK
jgi:hypothetical protein